MRSVVTRWGAGVAATGVAVLVVGTFLPWLRSGAVLRNSYQSMDAVRILLGGGTVGALRTVWLLVIPVCALCVALYAVRLRRTAAGLGCLVSVTVGTVATLLVVQGDDAGSLIGASTTGPAVTMAGAVIALVGTIVILVRPGGRPVVTTGGAP